MAQAKATFLEENDLTDRSRASLFTSKGKTESARNDIHEVRLCVNKWKTTLLEIKERRADFKVWCLDFDLVKINSITGEFIIKSGINPSHVHAMLVHCQHIRLLKTPDINHIYTRSCFTVLFHGSLELHF